MKNIAILLTLQLLAVAIHVYPQGAMIFNGEKQSLRGKHILDIKEDGKGNIWIISSSKNLNANEGHLCVYTKKGDWIYFKDSKEIYKQKFTNLQPENNDIMTCYFRGGMFTFDEKSWKKVTKKTVIENYRIPRKETIHEIIRDELNRTWVETSNGILLCKDNTFKRYLESVDFFDEWTHFSNGHVYSEQGTFRIIVDEFVKIADIDYENFRFKGCDIQNRGWYTTDFRDKRDLYFTVSYFSNNNLTQFYYDLPYVEFHNDMFKVPTFHFMPDNSVLIASGEFIGLMKNDALTELPFEDLEIPIDYCFGKVARNNNEVFIINYKKNNRKYDDGFEKSRVFLLKYDGTDFSFYLKNNEIFKSKKTFIQDMHVDTKGNIWLTSGTVQGVRFEDNKSFIARITSPEDVEIFDTEDDLNQSYYNIIFEDSQGRVWFGSTFDGIFMYQYE